MSDVSRRRLLAGGIGIGAAAGFAACNTLRSPSDEAAPAAGPQPGSPPDATATGSTGATATPTEGGAPPSGGDGSWRDAGPQPLQLVPEKLAPGDTPPQFVVISWDGAGESTQLRLLSHFRQVAAEVKASMTLFVSGIYMVPNSQRNIYLPPGRPAGSSSIPFLSPESVHATIDNVGKAWSEGHEIGTHFNGHFCGPKGVASWTPEQWTDEIEQAVKFVTTWRTTTGFTDLEPLPFDYRKELVGGRAPCLEGSANLRKAAEKLGWRYDSSATGTQTWPTKTGSLWALDLQSIPFVGHSGSVISMDYNMMYNQSKTPSGDPAKRPQWQKEVVDSYLAGFRRAYDGNRAPLFIGNHFEDWNGGIYMTAVEQVMRTIATYPDARMVSYRQLCDYLDAQDPSVLARLRTLPIGSAPQGGWKTFLQV